MLLEKLHESKKAVLVKPNTFNKIIKSDVIAQETISVIELSTGQSIYAKEYRNINPETIRATMLNDQRISINSAHIVTVTEALLVEIKYTLDNDLSVYSLYEVPSIFNSAESEFEFVYESDRNIVAIEEIAHESVYDD